MILRAQPLTIAALTTCIPLLTMMGAESYAVDALWKIWFTAIVINLIGALVILPALLQSILAPLPGQPPAGAP